MGDIIFWLILTVIGFAECDRSLIHHGYESKRGLASLPVRCSVGFCVGFYFMAWSAIGMVYAILVYNGIPLTGGS